MLFCLALSCLATNIGATEVERRKLIFSDENGILHNIISIQIFVLISNDSGGPLVEKKIHNKPEVSSFSKHKKNFKPCIKSLRLNQF